VTDSTEQTDREHHAVLGAAKVIAGCTLLSRVLGLVRDMLMAAFFGAGGVSDAFFYAWRVPNLFRRLFGEGAASSAMVPTFTDSLRTRTDEETQRLFSVTFTALFLLLTALTLLIEAIVHGLLWWGEFTPRATLLLEYLVVLMPYMVLICMSAFVMAVLNAHKRFFAPAMMPVVLNVVWIAAVYLLVLFVDDQAVGGRWLTLAILIGGGLQLLFQVPFAMREGVRIRPSLDFSDTSFRQILRLMGPVLIGSAVVQVNALVDATLALVIVPYHGAATHLYYGHRMMHLPIALIGVAISTAVLPTLSEHVVLGDRERFKRSLMSALRAALFLAIPASVGLAALSSPMIEVLFRHGQFSDTAADQTALVLVCYGLGVWAQTGVFVLLRGFYARKDTTTPLQVAWAAVLLNVVLNFTFIWFLNEAGLALATTLSGVAQLVVLFAILRQRLGRLGGRDAAVASMKTLAVSVVMGLAAAAAWYFLWPADASALVRVAVLAAIIIASIAVFLGGTALLRVDELKQLLRIRK